MTSPRDRPIVPLILAAGSSSRMGTPKALLEFDGRSVLELVLAACAGLAPPIVVTSPAGAAIRDRATALSPHAILPVNPSPEQGQLSSVQTGLRHLPDGTGAFLLFPLDHPLVRRDDVDALAEAWRGGGGIVIPSHAHRRGHPIVIDAALAPEFLALPATASGRVVVDADPSRLRYVAASERVLIDMDTPEDYARCLAVYRKV